MYIPPSFAETDLTSLHELIDAHPFAVLVDGAEVAFAPVLLDRAAGPKGTLLLHLARANPAARTSPEVSVVFTGPHGYVSPSWYARPEVHVPTWNWACVVARGTPRVLTDIELRALMTTFAARFETGPSPWSPGVLEPHKMDGMMKAIVGLAIELTSLEGKFKLSQNRSPEDHERVMRALRERGSPDDLAMAALMESRRPR